MSEKRYEDAQVKDVFSRLNKQMNKEVELAESLDILLQHAITCTMEYSDMLSIKNAWAEYDPEDDVYEINILYKFYYTTDWFGVCLPSFDLGTSLDDMKAYIKQEVENELYKALDRMMNYGNGGVKINPLRYIQVAAGSQPMETVGGNAYAGTTGGLYHNSAGTVANPFTPSPNTVWSTIDELRFNVTPPAQNDPGTLDEQPERPEPADPYTNQPTQEVGCTNYNTITNTSVPYTTSQQSAAQPTAQQAARDARVSGNLRQSLANRFGYTNPPV